MKKTYTKKQITEAIRYWERQLRKMNESAETRIPYVKHIRSVGAEDRLNGIEQKIWEIFDKFDGEVTGKTKGDGSRMEIDYNVTGHKENDGIGAYEYWGMPGYDKGTDYFEVDNQDFDEKGCGEELAKYGLGFEVDEETREINKWYSDEEELGSSCHKPYATEYAWIDVFVVDPVKFAEAFGLS